MLNNLSSPHLVLGTAVVPPTHVVVGEALLEAVLVVPLDGPVGEVGGPHPPSSREDDRVAVINSTGTIP